jgi:tellurite resistance protein TehA-like permease
MFHKFLAILNTIVSFFVFNFYSNSFCPMSFLMISSDVSAVRFLIQFAVVLNFFKSLNKLFDSIFHISENWCTEDLAMVLPV